MIVDVFCSFYVYVLFQKRHIKSLTGQKTIDQVRRCSHLHQSISNKSRGGAVAPHNLAPLSLSALMEWLHNRTRHPARQTNSNTNN